MRLASLGPMATSSLMGPAMSSTPPARATPWPLAARLLASDLLASGLSAAMLAWRGRVDTGHAAAPLNAISHWLWPRRALRENAASARFTGTGLAVHCGAALLWCGLYELLRSRSVATARATAGTAVSDALAVSAVAAVVDLAAVPDRLTPGFERRLSPRSLTGVYLAFAAGLALAGMASHGRR